MGRIIQQCSLFVRPLPSGPQVHNEALRNFRFPGNIFPCAHN